MPMRHDHHPEQEDASEDPIRPHRQSHQSDLLERIGHPAVSRHPAQQGTADKADHQTDDCAVAQLLYDELAEVADRPYRLPLLAMKNSRNGSASPSLSRLRH